MVLFLLIMLIVLIVLISSSFEEEGLRWERVRRKVSLRRSTQTTRSSIKKMQQAIIQPLNSSTGCQRVGVRGSTIRHATRG